MKIGLVRLAFFISIVAFAQIEVEGQPASLVKETDHSLWEIRATNPENYVGIALSNGRIGLMPSSEPFQVKSIILNNVYDRESENGVSKILPGINFSNLDVVIDGDTVKQSNITDWQQVLNMKEACLTTSFRFKNKAAISYKIYALRGLPYVGLMDVTVKSLVDDLKMTVAGKMVCPSDYKATSSTFRILRDNEVQMPLLQSVAKSPFGKHTLATTASFIFQHEYPELQHLVTSALVHELQFEREIDRNESYHFSWCGAVCTTQDFADPQNESERMVIYMICGNETMAVNQHKQLWDELWQSDIHIEGDPESQRDVRLALYHLYAFSLANSRLSVAPMGLSSQGYNGHIFWDSELWMFPPLLLLNHGAAQSMLDYRLDRLGKAQQKALSYGFNGAMFPWESDDTGEEATPTFALTGTFEHHITADVGIAFWNYYRLTHDQNWLKEKGFPVLREVAEYWVSRVIKNADGTYSIKNVVGADEFAPNVDDNAFTNGSVNVVLNYANVAASALNIQADPAWKEVADHISFNYFDDGVMKEHADYRGEIIKQADVNLLAYPLELVTDREAILRDLNYYEARIAEDGPAMGYSVLSVLYARLGDSEKAFDLFKRAYVPNKRPPFGALAEAATSNNPYFTTGAGGMLQVVLFGFAGLHLTDEGLVQKDPCLPESWKSLTITGVGPEKKTFSISH